MARSVNCVHLISNLTRDPELRYTSSGRPVCDIGLATNRQWKTETGKQKEDTEYHRIVAWGKLAEISSQYLRKGAKAYFQGRIATRSWTGQDGTQRSTTEIIAEDMMMLSPASAKTAKDAPGQAPTPPTTAQPGEPGTESKREPEVEPDEIPF